MEDKARKICVLENGWNDSPKLVVPHWLIHMKLHFHSPVYDQSNKEGSSNQHDTRKYEYNLSELVKYSNRQWPTVACWVSDALKCFDTRKKSLKTRSEA